METTEAKDRSWRHVLHGLGTANDRRNSYIFTVWLLAWAVAFVGANWYLRDTGEPAWFVVIAAVTIPTLVGAVGVWRYIRFVTSADELIRKIYLEALAIGFGGSALFVFGYDLAAAAGAPELSTDIVGLGMAAAWVIGMLVATWRYR